MILLHLVLLGLYGIAAWVLWPIPASATGSARTRWLSWPPWVIPLALVLHGSLAAAHIVAPEGLDLSFGNECLLEKNSFFLSARPRWLSS